MRQHEQAAEVPIKLGLGARASSGSSSQEFMEISSVYGEESKLTELISCGFTLRL
jgi:hypothetical protein